MGKAFFELLFWIVVFAVFFYGFRWLQNRKKKKNAENDR